MKPKFEPYQQVYILTFDYLIDYNSRLPSPPHKLKCFIQQGIINASIISSKGVFYDINVYGFSDNLFYESQVFDDIESVKKFGNNLINELIIL